MLLLCLTWEEGVAADEAVPVGDGVTLDDGEQESNHEFDSSRDDRFDLQLDSTPDTLGGYVSLTGFVLCHGSSLPHSLSPQGFSSSGGEGGGSASLHPLLPP